MSTPFRGQQVRLREGVMWGPIFPMQVRQVFKNGWLTVQRTDEQGRVTWAKVRHEDVEPDHCGPGDYHSTPHRKCIMR